MTPSCYCVKTAWPLSLKIIINSLTGISCLFPISNHNLPFAIQDLPETLNQILLIKIPKPPTADSHNNSALHSFSVRFGSKITKQRAGAELRNQAVNLILNDAFVQCVVLQAALQLSPGFIKSIGLNPSFSNKH